MPGNQENCNSAKILEALDKLLNFLRWVYAQDYPVSRDKLADAIDIGVSALAAPPRNCDVGKPEEQQDRFREFCRRHFDARECGLGRSVAKCPAYQGGKNPDCSLWWAQMPYEEGGAE